MKLNYDTLLSNFAFKVNLRHYIKVAMELDPGAEGAAAADAELDSAAAAASALGRQHERSVRASREMVFMVGPYTRPLSYLNLSLC